MDKSPQFEDFDVAGPHRVITYKGEPTPFRQRHDESPGGGHVSTSWGLGPDLPGTRSNVLVGEAKHENGWQSTLEVRQPYDHPKEGRMTGQPTVSAYGVDDNSGSSRNMVFGRWADNPDRNDSHLTIQSHDHLREVLKKVDTLPHVKDIPGSGNFKEHLIK